jgi:hypothetical protein
LTNLLKNNNILLEKSNKIRRGLKIIEEYLTAKQVVKYLQVKPLTIYQWARTDKIPAVKIARV